MPATEAVLFDLDGTLVALDVDIAAARRELAALFGPLGYAGGFAPVLPCIDRAARAVAGSAGEARALRQRGRAVLDRAERAGRLRARPGAGDLARFLAGAGIAHGIVTDNGRACAERACAELGIQPRVIVSRDELDRPKPDPEGVRRAARALLPDGGRLWVVGDSVRDVRAARAAALAGTAVLVIGVSGGRSAPAELWDAGADHVIDHLAELAGRLQRPPGSRC